MFVVVAVVDFAVVVAVWLSWGVYVWDCLQSCFYVMRTCFNCGIFPKAHITALAIRNGHMHG